jgi:molecular chaperone GrpE (heat shock protein)
VETLYEVRITLVNDNKAVAFELAKEYNKYFKVDEYLWSYEVLPDNFHIHGMVTYKIREPPSSTRSEWMAKQTVKKQGKSTSHHTEVDDELKYGAYIMKEGQYITNIKIDKINKYLERVTQVKEDKKKSAVHKLLERIKPKLDAIDAANSKIQNDNNNIDDKIKNMILTQENLLKISKIQHIVTLAEISEMIIDIYHNEFNKDMQWSKLKQYTIYIADKCGHCKMEIKNNIEKLF